ncbi:DNA primase family protein [Alicyclobacillus kakegawensis]|uniref:DNA primase family protein n=1 Tax=Alicyclobacillus kakegawensis TaxID=392012 RepID=UPI00082A8F4B|nr:phage/plasmid primase, P4 family [Alicyclobacillus kakegawensis]
MGERVIRRSTKPKFKTGKHLIYGLNHTQQGLAGLFLRLHGEEVRYCHDTHTWLVWDGNRWVRDETEVVCQLAMDTVKTLHNIADHWEAKSGIDQLTRDQVKKWAIRAETRRMLEEALKLCRVNPRIAMREYDFDRDPFQLNVINGTLDLRTGHLRDHRKRDYITMMAPVVYDEGATCPNWLEFLARVMGGDVELIEFVKRVVGYALTGDSREEKMFLLYGPPQAGKTTFLEIIRSLLGDYARQTDFSTFVATAVAPNAPRGDLVRLARARYVSASEVEGGQRFAEGLLKRLTGRDTVTARALYKESIEYRPGYKLFFGANDLPDVRADEEAIWRRICVIPFSCRIDDEDRDNFLRDKLEAELPGILKWAVEGCLDWQRNGLDIPGAVSNATRVYREESDTIKQFLEECCITGPDKQVMSSLLYGAYDDWCEIYNLKPISHKALIQYVSRRLGCTKAREGGTGRMVITGIALRIHGS